MQLLKLDHADKIFTMVRPHALASENVSELSQNVSDPKNKTICSPGLGQFSVWDEYVNYLVNIPMYFPHPMLECLSYTEGLPEVVIYRIVIIFIKLNLINQQFVFRRILQAGTLLGCKKCVIKSPFVLMS